MFRIFLSAIILSTLVACNASKNLEASRVGMVPLSKYVSKPTGDQSASYNFEVITGQTAFDSRFEAAPGATVTRPDFTGQVVVAILSGNTGDEIHLTKATIGGKDLNIYFETGKAGTAASPALATVPKSQSVKRVNFYREDKLVKTIPVSIQ